jgi:scyllo-inositol 2-dehydrogenase (NADP+)
MISPIITGILSYGMSGEVFHAPLLNALPEFELGGIVQRSQGKAEAHFPAVKIFRSVDELLRDERIELVIVNTPNDTHYDYALQALQQGKHVVVEKPFTISVQDADGLMAEAARRDRILTVFQNRRWDGDFLTVKRVLHEGLLGKVVEFEAHYDRFRNTVDLSSWKERQQPGTGILYNLGSHMLDQVVVLFGMPQYVDARIGSQRPGSVVDDYYDIRLEYDDKLVIVKSSYLVKENLPRYIIHGTNGSFVKHGIDPQEQSLKEKQNPNDPSFGVEEEAWWGRLNVLRDGVDFMTKVPSERGRYLSFYENVFRAIRHKAALEVKPSEARQVIRLIEACYESNENKRAVRLLK